MEGKYNSFTSGLDTTVVLIPLFYACCYAFVHARHSYVVRAYSVECAGCPESALMKPTKEGGGPCHGSETPLTPGGATAGPEMLPQSEIEARSSRKQPPLSGQRALRW